MAVSDPIADMFTRVRNALNVKHESVEIPFSSTKAEIAKILSQEGFIGAYEVVTEDLSKKKLKLELKYTKQGRSVISSLRRVSTPGKRTYIQKHRIPKVLNGFGIVILSTPKGVLTGRDARLKGIGGEFIGEVY